MTNSEIQKIYYDTFEYRYIKETETSAPPERYIPIYRGDVSDVYIEQWYVGNGMYLNVAYSQFEVDNHLVVPFREKISQQHRCYLMYLKSKTIPPELFNDYLSCLED